jgi:UDP-N-acetylmuramoyl-L-alanyl-D-glutamate--2,6-diaminopimelate ligase
MENYFAGKRRLFALTAEAGGRAVVNIDDPYGRRLAGELANALTFGHEPAAAVRPVRASVTMEGIEAEVLTPAGPLLLRSHLLGDFNLQNLLGAAAAGIALGLEPSVVAAGLEGASQVPGRLERVESRRGVVLVDYAHTGDALEKVLSTLAALSPRRIITIFGCGGDRDRKKRPVMGEIAARYSDLAVITSDNPRTEDPLAIIEEIRAGVRRVHAREWSPEEASGVPGKGFTAIADRRQAIGFAAGLLREGDILLVAGKGHEDYQIIGRERFPFDDREEVRRALRVAEGGA